jgi:hypothetical protein
MWTKSTALKTYSCWMPRQARDCRLQWTPTDRPAGAAGVSSHETSLVRGMRYHAIAETQRQVSQ